MATPLPQAPVRIGVLGCAGIARRRMLPAFAATPGARLVAVASRDAGRAGEQARAYNCRAVHGYSALLADDEIDAVYVPLPAALHAEWADAALRAGKHVLVEKPLAADPAGTEALFRLAAGRRLALMENVMFVHHLQHAAVRRLVDDGAIGELRAFQAEFTVPRLPDDDIRHRRDLGGGALADTGVYPVRAASLFLGDGLQVAGAVLTAAPGREVETHGAVLLRGPGGVTAQLTFGLDHGYRNTYELRGSEGRLVVERAFTPPAGHQPVLLVERSSAVREVRLPPDDQVRNTVRAFCAAVRSGTSADGAVREQARLLEVIRRHA